MERKLKYATEISTNVKSANCYASYEEDEVIAYRWTFSEITDKRNFLPRAMFPDIPNHATVAASCSGWSLSMFDSLKNASQALQRQIKKRSNIYKKLGTHIAEGNIDEQDGCMGDLNTDGHFEVVEYEGTDFSTKFNIVEEIVNCPEC